MVDERYFVAGGATSGSLYALTRFGATEPLRDPALDLAQRLAECFAVGEQRRHLFAELGNPRVRFCMSWQGQRVALNVADVPQERWHPDEHVPTLIFEAGRIGKERASGDAPTFETPVHSARTRT